LLKDQYFLEGMDSEELHHATMLFYKALHLI